MSPLLAASGHLLLLLLAATVACDVVHALLHVVNHAAARARVSRSSAARALSRPLALLASLHQSHHEFLDRALRFHDQRLLKNLACHQLPELLMRVAVVAVAARVLDVDAAIAAAAVALAAVDFVVAVATRGRDAFHNGTDNGARPLHAPRSRVFVDDTYHAMHHAYPDHFLSAHVQLLDRLLGRLLPLQDRVVVVVGGSAFCGDLSDELFAHGARVVRLSTSALDRADADDALRTADVVVCGQGASLRGDASYEVLLTRAQRMHAGRPLPLEVWTIGGDATFAARAPLLLDGHTVLRQLGRAPQLGAKKTLSLLRRGATTL